MTNDSLCNDKIEARQRLNSLLLKEAQAIVNRVLGADQFVPDLSHEIDWDEISAFQFDMRENHRLDRGKTWNDDAD